MKADLKQVLATAALLHDQAGVEAAIARMAGEIRADYPDADDIDGRPLFLPIMHGGFQFAARLAMELGLRGLDLALGCLHASHTLAGIIEWCRAQGAAEVRVAVLTVKEHDRCVEGVCADYVGLRVPDRYVFGYGMDYHEQGRNLPAIYAMAE